MRWSVIHGEIAVVIVRGIVAMVMLLGRGQESTGGVVIRRHGHGERRGVVVGRLVKVGRVVLCAGGEERSVRLESGGG